MFLVKNQEKGEERESETHRCAALGKCLERLGPKPQNISSLNMADMTRTISLLYDNDQRNTYIQLMRIIT